MSEKSRLLPTPRAADSETGWSAPTAERQNGMLLTAVKNRGSSPAVFPASHSVVPGSERATRMTVSSGLKCSALLRNSGLVGCLVRMLLESSVWRSTIVLLRWKPSATPRGRLLFRLAPSTPRTAGTGSGLWPTPKGEPSGPDFARASREGSGGDDLATRVAKMVGTPRSQERPRSERFTRAVKTPGEIAQQIGGQLNPTWVEWLMGYPLGWTDLSASGTPSCRK